MRERAVPNIETSIETIPDIEAIDEERFFADFVLQNRPVVVRGAIRDWPAVHRWSDAYLRDKLAGHEVETAHLGPSSPLRFMPGNGDYRTLPLDEYLDRYARDDRAYLTDSDVPPPLYADLGTNPMLDAFERLAETEKRTAMYLSHGRRTTPLHYDDEENLYCVVHGRKRFQLFDPVYLHHVYPYRDHSRMDHSQIDLDAVDNRLFPRFDDAVKQVVDLCEGDAVYVPCGWWHQVDSFDRSLAVSFVRLDEERLFAVFLRLVERGCIDCAPATWRQVKAFLDTPWSGPIAGGDVWYEEPLIVALVRYRLCRRHGGFDEDELNSARTILSQRIRSSALGPPVEYLLQNVFAIPLEGYFLR